MSCCGKKRSEASSSTAPSQNIAVAFMRGREFQYLGGGVLTVTGGGTGLSYRFVGHGARINVDVRDRASLALVPQLREVSA